MIKTEPFDAAKYLTNERAQRELVVDAGRASYIVHAMAIARARMGAERIGRARVLPASIKPCAAAAV